MYVCMYLRLAPLFVPSSSTAAPSGVPVFLATCPTRLRKFKGGPFKFCILTFPTLLLLVLQPCLALIPGETTFAGRPCPSSRLFSILPPTRANSHGRMLRNASHFSSFACKTERFKSSFFPSLTCAANK